MASTVPPQRRNRDEEGQEVGGGEGVRARVETGRGDEMGWDVGMRGG